MTRYLKIFIPLIVAGLILAACASNAGTAQPTTSSGFPPPQSGSTEVSPTQDAYPESQATPAGVVITPPDYPAPTQSDSGQSAGTAYPGPTEGVPPLTDTGYPGPGTFMLTLADGSEKTVAVDTLNALPKMKVSFDGTELDVLALTDAFTQYYVTDYNQISATGSGGASLTLTKDQIAQAYLEIHTDGTIRLVVQGLPQSSWVEGLASMKIN
jgi:hypothetical protein